MFFPSKHELEKNSNKSDKVYRLQENMGAGELWREGQFVVLLFLVAMKKREVRRSKVCVCDSINIIRVGEKTPRLLMLSSLFCSIWLQSFLDKSASLSERGLL